MRYSKEEKTIRLEDWKQSGKSAWAYAKENGICPQTFIRWTKPEKEIKPVFVEVPMKIPMTLPYKGEILIEKGDVKIHIPLELWRSELRAVMEGLGVL